MVEGELLAAAGPLGAGLYLQQSADLFLPGTLFILLTASCLLMYHWANRPRALDEPFFESSPTFGASIDPESDPASPRRSCWCLRLLRQLPWRWQRPVWWMHQGESAVLAAACTMAIVVVVGAVVGLFPEPGHQGVLYFERLVHLGDGVSPLVPGTLLGVALFAWGLFFVYKLFLASRFSVRCPFPCTSPFTLFRELSRLDGHVRSELMPPATISRHPLACLIVTTGTTCLFLKLWLDSVTPIDGDFFETPALGTFYLNSLLLGLTLCQFYYAWTTLKKVLRFVALLPMNDAFGRLPAKVKAVFGHYLFAEKPRNSHMKVTAQQYELLKAMFKHLQEADNRGVNLKIPERLNLARVKNAVCLAGGTLVDHFREDLDAAGRGDEDGLKSSVAAALHHRVQNCLEILQHFWPRHSMDEAFGRPLVGDTSKPDKLFLGLAPDDPVAEWVKAAEDFVAIEIVRYLAQFVAQIRNLLASLTVGSLLLLLAGACILFRYNRVCFWDFQYSPAPCASPWSAFWSS